MNIVQSKYTQSSKPSSPTAQAICDILIDLTATLNIFDHGYATPIEIPAPIHPRPPDAILHHQTRRRANPIRALRSAVGNHFCISKQQRASLNPTCKTRYPSVHSSDRGTGREWHTY